MLRLGFSYWSDKFRFQLVLGLFFYFNFFCSHCFSHFDFQLMLCQFQVLCCFSLSYHCAYCDSEQIVRKSNIFLSSSVFPPVFLTKVLLILTFSYCLMLFQIQLPLSFFQLFLLVLLLSASGIIFLGFNLQQILIFSRYLSNFSYQLQLYWSSDFSYWSFFTEVLATVMEFLHFELLLETALTVLDFSNCCSKCDLIQDVRIFSCSSSLFSHQCSNQTQAFQSQTAQLQNTD